MENFLSLMTGSSGQRPESDGTEGKPKRPAETGGPSAADLTPSDYRNAAQAEAQRRGTTTGGGGEPVTAERSQTISRAVDAFNEASRGGLTGWGFDQQKATEIFRSLRTDGERQQFDDVYRQRYGQAHGRDWGVERELQYKLSGANLDATMNAFRRGGQADDAGRLHSALVERGQWIAGRSSRLIEQDVRDTVATMNSKQIEAADKDYRARYGVSLRDGLLNDKNLSRETKEALQIYLNGADKRTTDDTLKLANIALRTGDMDRLREAFRDASPEARQRFMANKGEERLRQTFGEMVASTELGPVEYRDNARTSQARDFVTRGDMSAANLVRANTSWMGDNEKAIEEAAKNLSKGDRDTYNRGRELADRPANGAPLSEADRRALQTYRDLDAAFQGAGNATEVAKWRALASHGDSQLINRLADHRGVVYNDGADAVRRTIAGVNEADFNRLKTNPQFRRDVDAMLGTVLSGRDLTAARAELDKQTRFNNFQEFQRQGGRSVVDSIRDQIGTVSTDRKAIVESLSRMNEADQRQYRDPNSAVRRDVDKLIAENMRPGAEREAAQAVLQRIARGEQPSMGVTDRLNVHSFDTFPDKAKALREVQDSFAKTPADLARLQSNPAEARNFQTAMSRVFGQEDGQRYADSLLRTGRVPLDAQAQLNAGWLTNDTKGFFRDVAAAPKEERDRLVNDRAYQDRVLGALKPAEREIALNIARQGEVRPEDRLRAATLGWSTDKGEIRDVVGGLREKPEDLARARAEYTRKYGDVSEVVDAAASADRADIRRALREQPVDARARYNAERSDYYDARSGFGSGFVDTVWDGTGHAADRNMDAYTRDMTAYASQFREMPAEEQQQRSQQLAEALKTFIESKGAAADALVDTTVGVGTAAVGIGAAAFTGGVSLSLVAYAAAGGGLFKTAARAGMLGQNYDSSSMAYDFLAGGVNAGVNMFGPAEMAVMAGIGRTAAARTSQALLAGGTRELIKDGSEQALEQGLQRTLSNAIANGAGGVDRAAIDKLVTQVARDAAPETRERLAAAIAQNLQAEVQTASANALRAQARTASLNFGSGAAGGGLSGAITEAQNFDTHDVSGSVQRLGIATGTGAGFGGLGAGLGAAAFSGIGRVFRGREAAAATEAGQVEAQALRATEGRPSPSEVRPEVRPVVAPPERVQAPHVEPERQAAVETKLRRVSDEDRPAAIANVRDELGQVRDNTGRSVTDALDAYRSPTGEALSDAQKNRLLGVMADVRENYASFRTPERRTDSSQFNNWLHSQTKLTEALRSAERNGLSVQQTEDLLLAAALSDSVKNGGNFLTHHADSAAAAQTLLARHGGEGFSPERAAGIINAVREEHAAPAEFMSRAYFGQIREQLAAQGDTLRSAFGKVANAEQLTGREAEVLAAAQARLNNGRAFTQEEAAGFRQQFDQLAEFNRAPILPQDAAAAVSLQQRMANFQDPSVPRFRAADGSTQLVLSDHERALLRTTGIDQWHVPDASNPWNPITQSLREANARGNYASVDGFARMISARGPETSPMFRDTHLDDSIASVIQSRVDAVRTLPAASASDIEQAGVEALAAVNRVRARMESQIREELHMLPDARLQLAYMGRLDDGSPIRIAYPQREAAIDKEWWTINAIPQANRTPEQQQFWTAHRFDGLTDSQAQVFQNAMRIRDRFVNELQREIHGGSLPSDIRPINEVRARAASDSPWARTPEPQLAEQHDDRIAMLRNQDRHDIDGRPVEGKFREKVEAKFPAMSREQMEIGKAEVRRELSNVRASDGTSVLDKLENFRSADGRALSAEEKDRVLSALTEVREHYLNYRNPDRTLDFDQEVNWIHTQGELGRVLDSARANGLSPAETSDAMLASMFSDSVKAKVNFHTHHADGALAADHVLRNYLSGDFTPQRLDHIVQAIKEHQIGPPGFMSFLYTGPFSPPYLSLQGEGSALLKALQTNAAARSDKEAQLVQSLARRVNGGNPLNDEQTAAFAAELAAKQTENKALVLDADAQALKSLGQKLANPLGSPSERPLQGSPQLVLSEHERELLRRAGVDQWYVPDASTPWYRISQALIDGDSIDNYATVGGASKIVKIRGPESDMPFKDAHVNDSIASIKGSRDSALTVMSPEGRRLLLESQTQAEQQIEAARANVNRWLTGGQPGTGLSTLTEQERAWMRGRTPEQLPFWGTADGKPVALAYPTRTPADEGEWWKINKISQGNRTAQQQEFWLAHRFDGLTPEQQQDFQLAQAIRDRFAEELRRQQRVDGNLVPEFQPIHELQQRRPRTTPR